ncbi:unnamed protein product, partial [Mesorhabditis belari]|uniref:Kinase binding protein CGI-121 n=1 Tax=Mesorhabditis belari TaxID=2138241 RepID=A0AAF3EFA2_9BILA
MPTQFELNYDPFDLKKTRKITISLLKDVKNGEELARKIKENPSAATILDGKHFADLFVILGGINQALSNETANCMHAKNIYTEVIYCLSPMKRIDETLKVFGVNAETKHILVICFDEEPEILSIIQATETTLEALQSLADEASIRKVYELKDIPSDCLSNAILTKISSKDTK